MARYLVNAFFKDEDGVWHQPGKYIELEREKAAVYLKQGIIVAYQTQMVSPPETRIFKLGRRRKDAFA